MKLYYTPGACSLAVHIILNELHLDYDLEKVDIKTHQTETGQDFFKINPKGAVPTLELSKDVFLTEIVAILPFLAELDPNKQMIPNMGLERARVLEWLG
ncbi:glutathione S-transferase N-terminal domain-containing protein, partial [Acinetobacter sp. B5B]